MHQPPLHFVFLASSYPTPISFFLRRPADVPKLSPPPSPQSSGRYSLTSSLTSHKRRLVKPPVGLARRRMRLAEVEEGLSPTATDQMSPENEFWYGDCGYTTDANVEKMYRMPQIPIGTVVLVLTPTAMLMFSTKSPSPTKNRNREKCRRPGTASATAGMYHFSQPSCKYCRSRALLRGCTVGRRACNPEPTVGQVSRGVRRKG